MLGSRSPIARTVASARREVEGKGKEEEGMDSVGAGRNVTGELAERVARRIAAQLRSTRLSDPEGLMLSRDAAWEALLNVLDEVGKFPSAKSMQFDRVADRFEHANPAGTIPEARVKSMLQGMFSKVEGGVSTRQILRWLDKWTVFYDRWRAGEMATGAYASGRVPELGDDERRSKTSGFDRLGASMVWETDDDDTVLDARLFVHAVRLVGLMSTDANDVFPDPADGGLALAKALAVDWRKSVLRGCELVALSRPDNRVGMADVERILCLPVASMDVREDLARLLRLAYLEEFPKSETAEAVAVFHRRRCEAKWKRYEVVDEEGGGFEWGDAPEADYEDEDDEDAGGEDELDDRAESARRAREKLERQRERRLNDARERKRIAGCFRRHALHVREVAKMFDSKHLRHLWVDPMQAFLAQRWSTTASVRSEDVSPSAVLSAYEGMFSPSLLNRRATIKLRAARLFRVVCTVAARRIKIELLWWKAKSRRRRVARKIISRIVARWTWTSVLMSLQHMSKLTVEYHASLSIQCAYRRHTARQFLKTLIRWSTAVQKVQRWYRKRIRWFVIIHHAAELRRALTFLQKRLHHRNMRLRFRKVAEDVLKDERLRLIRLEEARIRNEAAIILQRWTRVELAKLRLNILWAKRAAQQAAYEEEQAQLRRAEAEILADTREVDELVANQRIAREALHQQLAFQYRAVRRSREDRAQEAIRQAARKRLRRRNAVQEKAIQRLRAFGQAWDLRIEREMEHSRDGLTLLILGPRPGTMRPREQETWDQAAKQWTKVAEKLAQQRQSRPADCQIDAKRMVVSHFVRVHHRRLQQQRAAERNQVAADLRREFENVVAQEEAEDRRSFDDAARMITKFFRQVRGTSFARFLFRTEWEKGYDLLENRYYYQSLQSGAILWDRTPRLLMDTDIDIHHRWDPYFTRRGVPYWFHPRSHTLSWHKPPDPLITGATSAATEEYDLDYWDPPAMEGHTGGRTIQGDPTDPGWHPIRGPGIGEYRPVVESVQAFEAALEDDEEIDEFDENDPTLSDLAVMTSWMILDPKHGSEQRRASIKGKH